MTTRLKGAVLSSDGSFRRQHGGWGIHGYYYNHNVIEKLHKGASNDVPTAQGYVDKKQASKQEIVEVVKITESHGYLTERPTSAHGELRGLYEALLQLEKHPGLESGLILTDSSYVVKGINDHCAMWSKNGWRTRDQQPVVNAELWQKIYALYQTLDKILDCLAVRHIKGHVGHYGNEQSDTAARLGSGTPNGEAYFYKETPYEEWLASFEPTAHHPLIRRSRLLFNVGRERTPGVYYGYHLGQSSKGPARPQDNALDKMRKNESYLGSWISDQIFFIVRQKTPDPYIEEIIDAHCEMFTRQQIDVAHVRLDNIYGKDFIPVFRRLGVKGLVRLDQDLMALTAADKVVTRTIEPAQRMFDALQEFTRMERHFNAFLGGTLSSNCLPVDLNERFFQKTQKSEKAKIEWKLTDEANSNPGYFDIPITLDGSTETIRLVSGIDIPDRNALAKIAGPDTKITLLIYCEGKQYSYEVAIVTEDAEAIYQSPHAQFFLA